MKKSAIVFVFVGVVATIVVMGLVSGSWSKETGDDAAKGKVAASPLTGAVIGQHQSAQPPRTPDRGVSVETRTSESRTEANPKGAAVGNEARPSSPRPSAPSSTSCGGCSGACGATSGSQTAASKVGQATMPQNTGACCGCGAK